MYKVVIHQLKDNTMPPITYLDGDTLNITEGSSRWSGNSVLESTVILNTRELVAVHMGYKDKSEISSDPNHQTFSFFVNGKNKTWDKLNKSQRQAITDAYTASKQAWWIRLPKKKWQPRITVEEYIKRVNDEIQSGFYGYSRAIAEMFCADYNASTEYIGFWTEYLDEVKDYKDAIAVLADAMKSNVSNGEFDPDNEDEAWLLKEWSDRTWVLIAEDLWGGAVKRLLAENASV